MEDVSILHVLVGTAQHKKVLSAYKVPGVQSLTRTPDPETMTEQEVKSIKHAQVVYINLFVPMHIVVQYLHVGTGTFFPYAAYKMHVPLPVF